MTAAAALAHPPVTLDRADLAAPVFAPLGPDALILKAGTVIRIGGRTHAFEHDTAVAIDALAPGTDYIITLDDDGQPVARPCGRVPDATAIGGFHFAPGGNASARAGGDAQPAINPCSIWDRGFRPACPDPRGMALVSGLVRPFWCDIYLLGTMHRDDGTSRHGAAIADGRALPQAPDGDGRSKKLDYETAWAIYAHHGKQLLGAEEFFAAAHGVTERSAADGEPETTGLDAARTSRFGLMQATGNMWVWGTDGDPDEPRPSLFGGSWIRGDVAGSRYAHLDLWPGLSSVDISARGRSDHLNPA